MKTLISQGAEAKLFKEGNLIIKERTPKSYRIKQLDEKIRKLRTRRETSILEKVSKLIPVPKLHNSSEFRIIMDYIEGEKLSDVLDSLDEKIRNSVCKVIGRQVALLHSHNIIHGDLTTSNMILKNNDIYFIDFGLSFIDQKVEHKAVDLHLLKQALESKHYNHFDSSFKAVLEGYKEVSEDYKHVIDRLDKVEGRGRYKSKKKTASF